MLEEKKEALHYLNQGRKILLGALLAFLSGITILLLFAKTILVMLFITLFLYLLLEPMVAWQERSMKRGTASALAILFFIGVLLLLAAGTVQSVIPDLSNFGKEFPGSISRFDQQEWLDLLPKEMAEYGKEMLKEATGIAVSLVKQSLVPLLKTFSSLVEMIAIPILTFYLLKDGAKLWQATANLLPVSVVAAMEPLGIDCLKVLKAYIRGQVLIAFFAGSVVFLGSLAFGLPHGAVLALVSAVSEFVPVIGTVIATVPGVLVGLMESPQLALKVLLFYVVLLKVNHNFIYPKVVGDAIRVHPLVILLAILLFGTLFGVIGMLFAVPSMAVGRIWLHHFAERRNLL